MPVTLATAFVRRPHRPQQRGLTLVEAAMVLGIVAVLAGTAAPSFGRLGAARTLDSAAAQLRTDIQLARSAAVAMGQTVRLRVQPAAQGGCYVVHTGAAGSCSCTPAGNASCSADAQPLRTAGFGSGQGLALQANVASLAFEPHQGTVTPTGTLSLATAHGEQLRVVVNIMGRARTCKVAGSLAGHPAC
jgi:type IV fimbrial biogenesis protein FimT